MIIVDCCLDVEWFGENTFASCGADSNVHILSTEQEKTSIKVLTCVSKYCNNTKSPYPMIIFSGHQGEVNQIKVNPSKTRLATCSDDRTARVWNISEYLGGSPDSIPGLGQDEPLILWGHDDSVSSLAWCPKQFGGIEILATSVSTYGSSYQNRLSLNFLDYRSSFDTTIRLWNSVTGQCLKVFKEHQRPVYALTFSPDGRWLGSGSGDGWLHIYCIKVRLSSVTV